MSYLKLPVSAGPFEIVRQIATGASSIVYEARNSDRDESVALKVFHPQLAADSGFAERLEREAQTLKSIQHPNVVRLIQSWNLDGKFFLELEYVHGKTLSQWAETEPTDWIEPRLWVLAGVARALGAVHQGQIVHRDLKPENVLISDSGQIKLTDFGLAKSQMFKKKLTQTGSIVGSLAYMAPETVGGAKATYASDIFSFGILAYELLCGAHPFFDNEGQLMVQSLLVSRYVPCSTHNPRIPHEISQLIDRCLDKDPAARPPSIWRVETALLEHLQAQGLLSHSKLWVESPEQQPLLLMEALKTKHDGLRSTIRAQLVSPQRDMRFLVSRINEFHALFPNDLELPEFLAALRTPKSKPRLGLRAGIALLVLLLVGSAIYGWKIATSETKPSSIAVAPQPPTSPPPQLIVPAVATIEPAPPTTPAVAKPRAKKPEVPMGALDIITERDVNATVDGRRIARSAFTGLKLTAGAHVLRLEKPGYPAIEQAVKITAGKTATVNTIPEGSN